MPASTWKTVKRKVGTTTLRDGKVYETNCEGCLGSRPEPCAAHKPSIRKELDHLVDVPVRLGPHKWQDIQDDIDGPIYTRIWECQLCTETRSRSNASKGVNPNEPPAPGKCRRNKLQA